jgi:membrane protease YdiL (CAAX protease family)
MPFETLLTAVGSIAVWAWIATRLGNEKPLLSYEPRRAVPWGPIGLIIALGLLSLKIVSLAAAPDVDPVEVSQFIWQAVVFSMGLLVATAVTAATLVHICRADRHDLGLPSSWAEFWSDVGIGLLTCAAAVLPVYTIKISLLYFAPEQLPHPLLRKLVENPDGALAAVVVFSAVIVAPIFEEFLYRLLLQGWLEKIDCPDPATQLPAEENDTSSIVNDAQPWPDVEAGEQDRSPYASPRWAEQYGDDTEPEVRTGPEVREGNQQEPPNRLAASGLPVGAMPIGVSAVLFALAHLGHGLDPIPLLILGVIFGYVYYRTHRLVPCVVAHMAFNALSLTQFWINLAWRS